MKYYNLLMNLFEPLVEKAPSRSDLATFVKATGQTPQEAISSAIIRLETLFRIYYLRHGFNTMDAYLLHFLVTLGFKCFEKLKDDKQTSSLNDTRCLLLMCALGLRDQGQYYYLVRTIFHLFKSRMNQEDVDLLKHYAQDENPEKDELYRPQDLISQYPLDIVNISDNPEKHRVSYLVKETKSLSLEPTDAGG
jgi:hypothetical protein